MLVLFMDKAHIITSTHVVLSVPSLCAANIVYLTKFPVLPVIFSIYIKK